ncbi:hypothetical protein PYW07_009313 [Mythimna separata]|uniref:FUN14 domain-containing protein 1 n=1 Tax=Mythimna separata TaxID=271217 RepID=A0AAD7YBD0_MYTSE|nr:hypothetical protein PYW07_009313 [Mythimna separata]
MARPTLSTEFPHIASQGDGGDGVATPVKVPSVFDITIDGLKSNTSKNLILGTFTGWLSGLTLIRIGRIAAFGLGGGIILLHFAAEFGYINVNWDKVKETAEGSQAWMEKLLQGVRRNSCFSVGFLGGFFFGVAST